MKYPFLLMIAMAGQLAWANTVSWHTFTGWDHGYTITVDGETSKITLVEHLSKTKNKEAVVRDLPGANAFVVYVKTLAGMIPGEEVGPSADDGRVIIVTAKSGDEMIRKEINMIDLYVPPAFFPSGGQSQKEVERLAKASAADFKKLSEAYMLQQMMFELKTDYFDRFKLDDSWKKAK